MCVFSESVLQMGTALKLQTTIRALVCGAEVVSINIVYEQLRARGVRPQAGAGRWSKQNPEPLLPTPRADFVCRLAHPHTLWARL